MEKKGIFMGRAVLLPRPNDVQSGGYGASVEPVPMSEAKSGSHSCTVETLLGIGRGRWENLINCIVGRLSH